MCDGACCGRRDIASQHQPRAGRQLQSGILERVGGTQAGSCLSRAVAGRHALAHRRCLCRGSCQGSRSNALDRGELGAEGGRGEGEKDEMTAAGGHVNQSNHTVGCGFPCFWEHSASVLSLLLATDSRNFRRRRRVSPSCLPCLQLPSRQLYSVYASRAVSGGHISPGPIDAARRLMLPHRSLPSQAVSLGSIP